MKKLELVIILFVVGLLFTSCEKNEEVKCYDSFSGVLMPGENVSVDELAGLTIYLGKLPDGVEPTTLSIESEEIELIQELTLGVDGSFTFNNLVNGNYILLLSEGFTFNQDEFITLNIDGITEPQLIKQNVRRIEPDNSLEESWDNYLRGMIARGQDNTPKNIGFKAKVKNEANLSNLKLNLYVDAVDEPTKSYSINEPNFNIDEAFSTKAFISYKITYDNNTAISSLKTIIWEYTEGFIGDHDFKKNFWFKKDIKVDYKRSDGVSIFTVSY